jgi:anti-sigma regulatory factor (Ser/Thr protein kinase)
MTAMTLTCPDAVETVLPGAPRSVSEARALVRSELGASTLTEAAVLAVSELATNAIAYSRSGLPGGTFGVTVQRVTDGAVIRVGDGGARTAPKLADSEPGAEHGRGLLIIAALAADWGTEAVAAGRVTWCRIERDRA